MKAKNYSIVIILFLLSIQNFSAAQQSSLVVKSFDLVDMSTAWIEGSNVMLITEHGGDTWEYSPLNDSWGKQHIDFVNRETDWVVCDQTTI